MKKFQIKTLGCKVNQYDTQLIREQLLQLGWQENEPADLYVINTCTVTEKSDAKARYYIRQARTKNPQAKVVLTGCFTQEMQALKEVDRFVPNFEKNQFLEKVGLLSEEESFDLLGSSFHISQFEGRTRAFVKIQEGCDSFCSYCIVPFVRGRSQSRPLPLILKEIESLLQNGYQEIVLTGVHLGSYGLKKGDAYSLAQVLKEVDQQMHPGSRLRLSSIEPMEISNELIQCLAGLEHLAPHFHLPLQSGSNRILEKMRRGYDVANFLQHTDLIEQNFKKPSISTDIIVGFPGETDDDFLQTIKAVEKVGFSKVHVFPYSPRSGTLASKEKELPKQVVKERVEKLTALSDRLALEHKKEFVGKEAILLVEEASQGKAAGFTENYLRVEFPEKEDVRNRFIKVQLTKAMSAHLIGKRL